MRNNPDYSKYSYLVKQSENVWAWISKFDPTNINTDYIKLPHELIQFDMASLSSRSLTK